MTLTSFGQVIPVTGPNIGFQGTVSRFGERVIAAREFVPYTSTNNLNFGDPAVIIPNQQGGYYDSVADFIAHATSNIGLLAAQFAGVAVREVKTQLTYPSNVVPGASPMVGLYAANQMAEVLERGSITVLLSVGSPNQGAQVYVRVVANSGVPAGFVGDWETNPAASDLFTLASNGSAAAGQAVIPVASTTNVQVGQLVYSPGGQILGYVASFIANTSFTISTNLNVAFASGTVFTLSNLFAPPGVVARTGFVDSNSMLEITLERRYAA